ncbi:cob(I)yrinic acid a,c-diamide adenosyltransferase [Alteromonas lipotrueiana]|uniref:cob(I)yrinic acid a,c-diamide adenosyltransferase n=1 Tax=Alteromonas lipotrueiana TaxID=2803815 RepID=UPI001C483130|nr:cob(I)yrinic acid a,c-diamide adenosyltransferase [Alteromonas lipotrueiana]
MKIYTRGGDGGQTRIYADKPLKVEKSDIILNCYGDIDELNSHVGLLVSHCQTEQTLNNNVAQEAKWLQQVQQNLFQLGYAISATSSLTNDDVTALEQRIDVLSELLAPQRHFILPGGHVSAAQAHVCRTVCRRAERTLVAASQQHPVPATTLAYINRLSDYFFILARSLNHASGTSDIQVPSR